MKAKYRALGKKILSKCLPDSTKLRHLLYLPRLEKFRKTHQNHPIFKNKKALYRHLNQVILNDQAIQYCEFGVYQGASIACWADINQHPDSKFVGFDTFTGLPEQWVNFTGVKDKHVFDTQGNIPSIADERVSFVKGLFQKTLPSFVKNQELNGNLVIHADADLYGSTLYLLTQFDPYMPAGTIIIFDEFSSMLHEFRALEDYCAAYLREFRVLGATISKTKYYTQVAICLL